MKHLKIKLEQLELEQTSWLRSLSLKSQLFFQGTPQLPSIYLYI